ncbi:hypothetical protein BS78_01G007800 [Paspalum vaginatum]|nr:hypothetical protein BS78_01G007800 [Paspalum vaginatum]
MAPVPLDDYEMKLDLIIKSSDMIKPIRPDGRKNLAQPNQCFRSKKTRLVFPTDLWAQVIQKMPDCF